MLAYNIIIAEFQLQDQKLHQISVDKLKNVRSEFSLIKDMKVLRKIQMKMVSTFF